MKAERAQLISEERFETRKQDEFYKENLQKLSAAINQIPAPRRSPRLRNKPKGAPILSYPILSYPILSYPILSYSILSYSILPYPILS